MAQTISSLEGYTRKIRAIQPAPDEVLLYRGHSDRKKFKLLPSVLREPKFVDAEHTMYARNDESNLAMFDAKGKARVELKNSPKGSALGFRDDNGTDRVDVALGSPFGGGIVINDANSITRTILTEDVGLATYDGKGSFLWAAGLDSFDKESQKRIRETIDAMAKAK